MVREKELTERLSDGMYALTIPNAEIREIFETTVKVWFDDSAKSWDRKALFEACLLYTSLLDQVWGEDYFGDARIVDTHIKNLRKKLGNQLIETVRGVGYRLEKIKK